MQVGFRAENKPLGVLHKYLNRNPVKKTHAFSHSTQLHVPVSAVIITYNEEKIIADTISRLWWCDEIIVVDSGSTDSTVNICKEYGCTIFTRSFNGFGEQKNYGVSKATNDWILCIDADEILTESLIDEFRTELGKDPESFVAYSVPRNLVFMNKTFQYGKETNAHVIRLFNKTKAAWDYAVVHESVLVKGPIKKLNERILHYSYTGYSQFINKINLYSTLGAKKLLQKKSTKSKALIILSIPFNFFRYYIIDRNFLNGYRGFAWAVLNSCYHFIKYLKLEEMRKEQVEN